MDAKRGGRGRAGCVRGRSGRRARSGGGRRWRRWPRCARRRVARHVRRRRVARARTIPTRTRRDVGSRSARRRRPRTTETADRRAHERVTSATTSTSTSPRTICPRASPLTQRPAGGAASYSLTRTASSSRRPRPSSPSSSPASFAEVAAVTGAPPSSAGSSAVSRARTRRRRNQPRPPRPRPRPRSRTNSAVHPLRSRRTTFATGCGRRDPEDRNAERARVEAVFRNPSSRGQGRGPVSRRVSRFPAEAEASTDAVEPRAAAPPPTVSTPPPVSGFEATVPATGSPRRRRLRPRRAAFASAAVSSLAVAGPPFCVASPTRVAGREPREVRQRGGS